MGQSLALKDDLTCPASCVFENWAGTYRSAWRPRMRSRKNGGFLPQLVRLIASELLFHPKHWALYKFLEANARQKIEGAWRRSNSLGSRQSRARR